MLASILFPSQLKTLEESGYVLVKSHSDRLFFIEKYWNYTLIEVEFNESGYFRPKIAICATWVYADKRHPGSIYEFIYATALTMQSRSGLMHLLSIGNSTNAGSCQGYPYCECSCCVLFKNRTIECRQTLQDYGVATP